MFASWLDHPVVYSFTRSRLAQSAGLIALVMVLGAVFAPWLAPSNPFDLASLDLNDALLPPAWQEQGSWKYWLGTDDQGRDVFSTILYGSRISLLVGVSSVLLAMFLGVSLGLISGFVGGRIDAVIMRVADVQLSFPAILIALLIDGVA
ncbi:MAG: ABC transporter permease, partial [Betaproteobacteria bacterium]|nr:ABC transporter permease [Betaproteobacteria bacterium]